MRFATRCFRPLSLLVLLAATLLSGVAPVASVAHARDADVRREIRDRAEIEALMWRYVRALDSLDADTYAAVYTPDGRFIAGTMSATGPEQLRKIITDIQQRRAEQAAKGEKPAPMHHIITNSYLEFLDRDHARLNAYWMTVFEGSGPEAPPRVAAAGRSVDELLRLNGRWLIHTRDVTPRD
jgi:hypothetical protein